MGIFNQWVEKKLDEVMAGRVTKGDAKAAGLHKIRAPNATCKRCGNLLTSKELTAYNGDCAICAGK